MLDSDLLHVCPFLHPKRFLSSVSKGTLLGPWEEAVCMSGQQPNERFQILIVQESGVWMRGFRLQSLSCVCHSGNL